MDEISIICPVCSGGGCDICGGGGRVRCLPLPSPGQSKTQRVRILVAIDGKGNWASANCGGQRDDDVLNDHIRVDYLDDPFVFHWIEADVPIPQETTIAGVATPD